MIDNYSFLNSIDFKVCDTRPTSEFFSSPQNIILLSTDNSVAEKILVMLKSYRNNQKYSHCFFPGILKETDRQFSLFSEILNNSKCKIFILQNKLSELKFLLEALDIACISPNVQLFHNSSTVCHEVFSEINPRCLENIVNIGISATQTHLSSKSDLTPQYFDSYRLGQMIHQMEVINDAIAFADIVVADISAIKQSDIPGRRNISSSGLSSEAFNHIARNAGIGKSRVTVLTGLESLDPGDDIGIDALAQFVFYFLDGAHSQSSGTDEEILSSYTIDECLPFESVNFLKSEFTGRWFAEFPTRLPDHLKKFQLIPCSYQDYQYSARGELSPRILDIFKRLDELVN